jgi:2-isopropylmalate synthase
MLIHPSHKYKPFAPISLTDRTWPNKTIVRPPIWLSTDLRDGNQALIEPMDIAVKLRLFHTLVAIGFKEIEIGFPAASQTEFDFVRHLIEHNLIPDDVTIQVLTPAKETLIQRTFASLRGAKSAIVHLYNATAPVFRQVVFGLDKPGTIQLATEAAHEIKQLAAAQPDTNWRFQYSPEVFTSTELSFARDICNAVLAIWQPTPANKAIVNLPASVEVSTPNIFADQVEWMHRHLHYRDAVVLCVHPHNDRGCSVAAAELAQMAGAQRVEGCLFGNGERTGNVDLVTLAMNLYTQGISPGLDFSEIDNIVQVAEACTQLPVHPRHPYAGELVFTAFSGSHQDAIKKGFAAREHAARKHQELWAVPYLPMDPADVGRTYESVVRINSQSGKGGIAFLLERDYGVVLPRRLQIEFSRQVQQVMDASGKEMSATGIWALLIAEYFRSDGPLSYSSHQSAELSSTGLVAGLPAGLAAQQVAIPLEGIAIAFQFKYYGDPVTLKGMGNGPIDALVDAVNSKRFGVSKQLGPVQVRHYEQRSLGSGSHEEAIALIEIATQQGTGYGIGIHSNIVTASFYALVSAINRQLASLVTANKAHAEAAQIC